MTWRDPGAHSEEKEGGGEGGIEGGRMVLGTIMDIWKKGISNRMVLLRRKSLEG